jgi:hypothetical protein
MIIDDEWCRKSGKIFLNDMPVGGWETGLYRWQNLEQAGLATYAQVLKEAADLA